jgi:hypothetical protein
MWDGCLCVLPEVTNSKRDPVHSGKRIGYFISVQNISVLFLTHLVLLPYLSLIQLLVHLCLDTFYINPCNLPEVLSDMAECNHINL